MPSDTTRIVRPPPRWVDPPVAPPDRVRALQERLGLPAPLCALLLARGLDDAAAAQRFLEPGLAQLHPPTALRDTDRAVDRVVRAIERGETILVHGDYDVDGMTSVSLLTRVLTQLGARVVPFVPHRVRDGYDLGTAGLAAALGAKAGVVITCDCGTSAHDTVARLRAEGVDVIITDHHLPVGPLPDALAVLNPRRPDCEYPDKDLVAAGVVFKLALALVQALGADERIVTDLLDLVAVATVADVAPLRGENRVLVHEGLKRLRGSRVAGLRALLRSAGLEQKALTAGRIGFILAPRLNATGRIGHAMRGVDLLLTDADDVAFGIARELEEQNRKRQDLDRRTLDEARALVAALDAPTTAGIVLAREGWHPGVIGIVASRVVEETGRPTMLIAVEDGVGKGSGRSIPAFDLHGALAACSERFERFGGHRAAAGITIRADEVSRFAREFNAIASERLSEEDFAAVLRLDLELPLSEATESLHDALRGCEPHGIGNAAPVFVARAVGIEGTPRRVGDSGLKMRLAAGSASLDAIAWDLAPRMGRVDWRAPLDVAYRLERDEWNGRSRLQARVLDVRQ
jgi:single-stranded-DNA-specific exonuclease